MPDPSRSRLRPLSTGGLTPSSVASLIALVFLLSFPSSTAAFPGDYDTSFGGTGIVRSKLAYDAPGSWTYAAAAQSGDRLVLGANEANAYRGQLVRLTANGLLDPSF